MLQQQHILIVGGAYAGLSTLNALISLSAGRALPIGPGPPGQAPSPAPEPSRPLNNPPRYTLLDERDGFYHTVGAPLGQISPSYAREFWLKYDNIVKDTYANEEVDFVQGKAVELDMEKKVLSYSNSGSDNQKISYDYLVVATGMRRGPPVVPTSVGTKEFLAEVDELSAELSKCKNVVIVGGGAVGIEMAAKVKLEYPQIEVILVHSREQLVSAEPLPDTFKAKALELLLITGTQVKLGNRVIGQREIQDSEKGPARIEVSLSSGEAILCDKIIYSATQKGANTEFIPKEAKDADGCILVQDTVQLPTTVPNWSNHFAAGDATEWAPIKRAAGAQHMGKVAASNIIKMLLAIEDGTSNVELEKCSAFPASMSLAIGEQAMGLRGDKMMFGKEVMQLAFGRGLGIEGTLKMLNLTPVAVLEERELKEQKNEGGSEKVAVAAHM